MASQPEQEIHLRATTTDDLDFVIQSGEDQDTRPFILPWTREQHAAALVDPDLRHLIIEHPTSGPVGFVLLAGFTSGHDRLEFRRIVVTDKCKGIGRAAVRAIKRLAFVQHRAHRLWLDVKQQNHRARRLYESEGFVVEGTMRECLKVESGYDSLVVMSMLSAEFRDQE